jgi:acyl-coenzyme A thioesterase PaaI-like protein
MSPPQVPPAKNPLPGGFCPPGFFLCTAFAAVYTRGPAAIAVRMHVKTIPACIAIGMSEYHSGADGTGAWIDLALPVCRGEDGLPSRGAALILADQAAAVGTYSTFETPSPMMTLDLRVDWHGAMPAADRIDVRIEDTLRQGNLALVRGIMLADGQHRVGSIHATFLIGAYPGGQLGEWQDAPLDQPQSSAPHFEAAMRMERVGDDWHVAPDGEMIGARPIPAYHGGFVAALLEQACFEVSGKRQPVNFDIRYLLPTRADLPLKLRTRVLRSGKQASIIEADALQGEADTIVATARTIFLAETQVGQRVIRFP